MICAILSDIHSNFEALSSVLELCKNIKVTHYVCLGDIVGYGPDPIPCLETIMSLNCDIVVRGNHEEYIVNDKCSFKLNEIAKISLDYTRDQLNREHKEWISSFPYIYHLNDFIATHGTPFSPSDFHYALCDYFMRKYSFEEMKKQNVDLCFVGHSHVPCIMKEEEDGKHSISFNHDIFLINSNCIIDVGSVGQPRNRDFHSSFVVYYSSINKCIFHKVDYDVEKTMKKIKKAGLPSCLASRLKKGT